MFGRIVTAALATLGVSCNPVGTTAQTPSASTVAVPADQDKWLKQCDRWDEWDKPGPPFKVHGNTYYVGTCGISAILVTGDEGHILIDTGTENAVDLIVANIRDLGFDPQDVKIMLHSHEHFDHVGGFAKMQAATNARIIASVTAARVLGTGIVDESDPQHGMHDPMAPVATNALVLDGETVTLGNLELIAIETPGHSPGALSWQWRSCEGENCRSIVYADSLSPVSSDTYRFSDHAAYVAEFRQSLGRVASVDCEILLTPHPSASNMVSRLASGEELVDPSACLRYAEGIARRLDERLDKDMNPSDGR